jgi:hypothetical protein
VKPGIRENQPSIKSLGKLINVTSFLPVIPQPHIYFYMPYQKASAIWMALENFYGFNSWFFQHTFEWGFILDGIVGFSNHLIVTWFYMSWINVGFWGINQYYFVKVFLFLNWKIFMFFRCFMEIFLSSWDFGNCKRSWIIRCYFC